MEASIFTETSYSNLFRENLPMVNLSEQDLLNYDKRLKEHLQDYINSLQNQPKYLVQAGAEKFVEGYIEGFAQGFLESRMNALHKYVAAGISRNDAAAMLGIDLTQLP